MFSPPPGGEEQGPRHDGDGRVVARPTHPGAPAPRLCRHQYDERVPIASGALVSRAARTAARQGRLHAPPGAVRLRMVPGTPSCLVIIFVSVALAPLGCAGGSGKTSGDAAAAASADAGDAAGTTCPRGPDLTAAAPACNRVVNTAHAVPFTARTAAPPQ